MGERMGKAVYERDIGFVAFRRPQHHSREISVLCNFSTPPVLNGFNHSFSENYADSRWCLNELLAIIESIASDDRRIVLPIFYHVNPSDVRHQRGSYATRHTSPVEDADEDEVAMIENWQNALTAAANLTGYHVDPNT
ncbi:TMV resistance protein N [Vitis vinifera]|uniref:ADP-ribosyl cyclase/cyclic ADP-ribose hydrolase n=1 Tax=Vitis vinifera TaxID=29760 RepID=A0A438CIY5_VITVI|nr:TMV resistance protein N [Vitis vinifera]